MKQIEINIGKQKTKKKKASLEYRTLVAEAELKKLNKERERLITNNKRYYLHRRAKHFGLLVFASRRLVLITGDLTGQQQYYCSKLLAFGYNIQEAIS
ncbi:MULTISPECIES: hypothetical protein [unclassified Sphingobacterium]|uniref:hypothetical protein n=1 Tax=unclassified Sphingobacterium TaxID=2609468 RepID=UPI0025E56F8B|nr:MULTISPECIES: hypothetical protein [unclassified Sphingobacterium]